MKTRMAIAAPGLGTLLLLSATGRAQDDWQKAYRAAAARTLKVKSDFI